jgi:hypothetical protein
VKAGAESAQGCALGPARQGENNMFQPTRLRRGARHLLLVCAIAVGAAGAAPGAFAQTAASEKDALRATLLESKEKSKGVTLHAKGANIAMVVTAIDERYVTGRNQQSSRIVVRIDQIDGVSAAF